MWCSVVAYCKVQPDHGSISEEDNKCEKNWIWIWHARILANAEIYRWSLNEKFLSLLAIAAENFKLSLNHPYSWKCLNNEDTHLREIISQTQRVLLKKAHPSQKVAKRKVPWTECECISVNCDKVLVHCHLLLFNILIYAYTLVYILVVPLPL